MGRWLKTIMKQVIAVVKRDLNWVNKSAMLGFAFMASEVKKISLEVFDGSASHDFFHRSIFSFLLTSDLSWNSEYAEEVQLG
jgi:hypothetical protein